MKATTQLPTQVKKQSIIVSIIVLLYLLSASIQVSGQSLTNKVDFNEKYTQEFIIKQFTAKQLEGKIYFNFLIVEQRENTKYVLESSTNGVDFTEVQKKDGFKSPNSTPLLYCYTVDVVNRKVKEFRIRIEATNTIEYSNRIKIDAVKKEDLLITKK